MKRAWSVLAGALAGTAFAAPVVSNVTFSQDADTQVVSVRYDLAGEPAVVTVDILSNGVSFAEAGLLRRAVGDVNRRVSVGGQKCIAWAARADIPESLVAAGDVRAVVTAWPTNDPPPYLCLNLDVTNGVRFYACEGALPAPVGARVWRTEKMLLKRIPAAGRTWTMGVPTGEVTGETLGTAANPSVRRVLMEGDCYAGVFPVTQRQYWLLQGGRLAGASNPCAFKSLDDADLLPAENVPYDAWCATLERARDATGLSTLNLPTEAQWEFACRAGTTTGLNNGRDCAVTTETADTNAFWVAWYGAGYGTATAENTYPVGLRQPNGFGLYDLHGNVAELCLERFSSPGETADVVCRGGSYADKSDALRSGRRGAIGPGESSPCVGARLFCAAQAE